MTVANTRETWFRQPITILQKEPDKDEKHFDIVSGYGRLEAFVALDHRQRLGIAQCHHRATILVGYTGRTERLPWLDLQDERRVHCHGRSHQFGGALDVQGQLDKFGHCDRAPTSARPDLAEDLNRPKTRRESD